jgi:hypothetical protein
MFIRSDFVFSFINGDIVHNSVIKDILGLAPITKHFLNYFATNQSRASNYSSDKLTPISTA